MTKFLTGTTDHPGVNCYREQDRERRNNALAHWFDARTSTFRSRRRRQDEPNRFPSLPGNGKLRNAKGEGRFVETLLKWSGVSMKLYVTKSVDKCLTKYF